MFGRKKRRQEEDPLGLSTIGSTGSVAPAGPPTPAEPAVPAAPEAPGASAAPAAPQALGAPGAPAAPAAQQPNMQTFPIPGGGSVQIASSSTPWMFTAGMQSFGAGDVLKQVFGGSGPIHDLLKEIQSDPQAFREKMAAQMQAAGVSTFMVTPQGYQQLGSAQGAPSAQHVDVIEELTKAADLHDKGALTDAEFEALKHKLLGH
jgi:hypothetical protein